jgi:hypothetical protein
VKRSRFSPDALDDRLPASIQQVDLTQDIEKAHRTAEQARLTREDLRKTYKPGTKDRERIIEKTLRAIDESMRPIRSAIGKIAWGQTEFEDQLRDASAALQYERKQLKKMRR